MSKRYLISTAGFPNFGDEQIVRTWLKFYQDECPNDQIILDVPFPARASFLFQGEFENIQFVDTIWNLVYLANAKGLTLKNEPEVSAILHGGDPRNTVPIREMFESDKIHILGGGYFSTEHDEFSYTYLFFMMLALIKQDKPEIELLATGVGLTPINDEIVKAIGQYTAAFSYLGVRDQPSLIVPNTTFEPDDVVMSLHLSAIKLHENSDNPDILLSIQPFKTSALSHEFLRLLIEYLRQPRNRTKKIGILEAMVPEDNWLFFSNALQAYPDIQSRVVFFDFWTIWQQGMPVKPGQEWISTRFHYHLIGALLGYKGTAIGSGSPYYAVKHTSLIDLGTSWQYILLEEGNTPSIQPKFHQLSKIKLGRTAKKKFQNMRQLLIKQQ